MCSSSVKLIILLLHLVLHSYEKCYMDLPPTLFCFYYWYYHLVNIPAIRGNEINHSLVILLFYSKDCLQVKEYPSQNHHVYLLWLLSHTAEPSDPMAFYLSLSGVFRL